MGLRWLNADELGEKHLSVIRELGRVVGVKAPASKKKEEIIKEIIDIQNGRLTPEPPNKRGAPPKIKVDLSEFEERDVYDESTPYPDIETPKLEFHDYINKDGFSDKGEFVVDGILEQHVSGYGFLRVNNYENSKNDIYVSMQNIKAYNLRKGDKIKALAKFVNEKESAALQKIALINDLDPELFLKRANFDDLKPCYPENKIELESNLYNDISLRFIDLFAPIGKGQRGLIVAPPKTGKTSLLRSIATCIEDNYPDIKLIVLLIDERPEEVTDIKNYVNGEVVFSTFDESAEHHIRAAELVVNRAKRLVEVGKDVVILMDSITRLTRAYNNVVDSSGKTLSGGLDPMALLGPKRFFGAARNIVGGGSLTIISTALIETGSRMDDVIYEEFKGTGNMEILLSRELAEKRIFPAIDIKRSGTREEERILKNTEFKAVNKLRRALSNEKNATEIVIEMLQKTKNNDDFCEKLDTWLKYYNKKNEIE